MNKLFYTLMFLVSVWILGGCASRTTVKTIAPHFEFTTREYDSQDQLPQKVAPTLDVKMIEGSFNNFIESGAPATSESAVTNTKALLVGNRNAELLDGKWRQYSAWYIPQRYLMQKEKMVSTWRQFDRWNGCWVTHWENDGLPTECKPEDLPIVNGRPQYEQEMQGGRVTQYFAPTTGAIPQ